MPPELAAKKTHASQPSSKSAPAPAPVKQLPQAQVAVAFAPSVLMLPQRQPSKAELLQLAKEKQRREALQAGQATSVAKGAAAQAKKAKSKSTDKALEDLMREIDGQG